MLEIKLLPGSEVEIISEVPAEEFESRREEAVKELSAGMEIKGFRPGKAPEKIILDAIGEEKILNKMALLVLEKEYSKIIFEKKIKAIGRPLITITKIASNNPFGFKIRTYVMPEVELPDYKGMKFEEILGKAKMEIPRILLEAENGDEKRVKASLVLNEIAEREKIEVSEEELNPEAEKIMKEHPELDRERVKVYTYGIIRNNKVLNFLESHAGTNSH